MEEMKNTNIMENEVNENGNENVNAETESSGSIVPVLVGIGLVGLAVGTGIVKLTKVGSKKLTEYRIKKLVKQGYEIIVPVDVTEVPDEYEDVPEKENEK